jgi:hypothetical protein
VFRRLSAVVHLSELLPLSSLIEYLSDSRLTNTDSAYENTIYTFDCRCFGVRNADEARVRVAWCSSHWPAVLATSATHLLEADFRPAARVVAVRRTGAKVLV